LYRYCLIIALINAVILEGRSQIIPAPGAKLNYTQIMFEHPQVKGADAYIIQVAVDTTANTFAKPIAQRTDSSTAAIISHLQFGQEYLWRYCGVANGKKMNWQGPFKFEIIAADCIDTSICRVKVLINDTGANSGGLIILDRDQSIVDRDGNFVWYMPMDFTAQAVLHSHGKPGYGYSDLRITSAGNLTLLAGSQAMEVDLNGNIIWQAPPRSAFSPDTLKLDRPYDYHHCFEKLASGNYMVLGRKSVLKPAGSGYNDTAQTIVADEMILEFDTSGKLVWQWNSDVYFDSVEIKNLMGLKPDSGLIDLRPGGHLNAFYADEKNGFVYAGFRNVSRVIKIDKKTGQVVCEWGSGMKYHGAPNADGFFKKQHETTLLRDGNMAVFNNSGKCAGADSGMPPASSIVIFSQPSDTANSRLLWQFDCRFDTANNVSLTGGSIDELKNGNLLAGMGLVGRIFE
jgi:Arylsulfotransferase (ASST)